MLNKVLRRARRACSVVRPSRPPVLFFALRRGGSTMVADAITANRGVFHHHEPLAVIPGRRYHDLGTSYVGAAPHSHYFALGPEEEAAMARYVDHLVDGTLVRRAHVGSPRGLVLDRASMKVLNAPYLMEWMAARYDTPALAMLRHPAAQAKSVLRQGWTHPVHAYAARADELGDRLSAEQRRFLGTLDGLSDWQVAIADWCVETVPMRRPEDADAVVTVLYEDVVAAPERFVDEVLTGRFGLEDREAMLDALGRPSQSSEMTTSSVRDAIASGDVTAMTERWRNEVTEEEGAQAQEVLDLFGVTEYAFSAEGPPGSAEGPPGGRAALGGDPRTARGAVPA